jgi:hypothetical protein
MRVYDLEQGRSVERLDGHVRIKPLPTKLFTPGQRVFTPRYRPFIPNSAKLPPAVMLRFDRPLERAPARPLCCRLGCRVTEPGRAEGSSCFNELERENATLRRLLAVTLQCAGVSEQFACYVTGCAISARVSQRRRKGWAVNHEKIQCLWHEQGLRVHGAAGSMAMALDRTADRNRGCARIGSAADCQFDITSRDG